AVVTSGANMNFDRLRFVAERAEVGEKREAVFAVTIPERRGSFKRLCKLVGERSVTEFNYRISDSAAARVFVGVQLSRPGERRALHRAFEKAGFPTLDLTDDELAKEHLRHLVGGRSPLAHDEHLYRFEFPERPGRSRASWPACHRPGTSRCFTTATRGPIRGACWSACRCRRAIGRRCAVSWPSSVTGT